MPEQQSTFEQATREKNRIALSSVIAAVFLTGFKLIVGISTQSLGILSEALHSGLDLVAAGITLLAVRYADKPADHDHHFGHGKIENFSALIETLLLVITCFWIIYESYQRLTGSTVHLEVTFWSFFVMAISIIVDFSRSRALMRIAKKYNSQALEADALHFSTDIYSSAVVIFGLVCVSFGVHLADPIAALIVALIVLWVSYNLGKKSFDVLTDKAPQGVIEEVTKIVSAIPEVLLFHDIRAREAGAHVFIELNIHVAKNLSIEQAHEIADTVEKAITGSMKDTKVIVHAEPDQDINNGNEQ